VSSISYDAVQLALFPLLFAYMTRFMVLEEPIKPRDLLIVMVVLAWIVNVRLLSYYPFLLIFFMIEPRKVAPDLRRYATLTGAFFAVAILVTAVTAVVYLPQAADSAPEGFNINASQQISYVLDHPWNFIAVSYKTMQVEGDLLLRELVGVFGWIDYDFNYVMYYLFTLLAGIVFFQVAQREVVFLKSGQVAAIFAAIVLTTGALFFSLYAVWSPVGADAISGLQGRYFLGLLPFLIVGVSQTAALVGREGLVKGLVLALALVFIYNIYRAVDLRYYE
jgi:uncharacterized membrane protein